MNEETLKAVVIEPLLRDLGFALDELRFETSFSIRLGRSVFTVDGREKDHARGRADIVCYRGSAPLLLVETKAPGEAITTADREQALTYARLLSPMPPLALVTNGEAAYLLDVVTGREHINGGSPLAVDLATEIALRYDAARAFFGYSPANVRAICALQVARELARLRADPAADVSDQLLKKYVPGTYVTREAAQSTITRFLAADTQDGICAIVGVSGTGKTCLMCHISESATVPVLFFSGAMLTGRFVDALADEFNTLLSVSHDPNTVFKKIASLFPPGERPMIMIDAVDEWDGPDVSMQLDQLVAWCRDAGMKLVLSCNDLLWPSLLKRRGIETRLGGSLFQTITLGDFDSAERETAVRAYASFLGVESTAVGSSDNPFFLRLEFESAYFGGAGGEGRRNVRGVIGNYVDLKFEKAADSETARRVTNGIAAALCEEGTYSIDEDAARRFLKLLVTERLPPELFAYGILQRTAETIATPRISFYFSLIRDYVVGVSIVEPAMANEASSAAKYNDVFLRGIAFLLRTGDAGQQTRIIDWLCRRTADDHYPEIVNVLFWSHRELKGMPDETRSRAIARLVAGFGLAADDRMLAGRAIDVVIALEAPDEAMIVCFRTLLERCKAPFTLVADVIANHLRHSAAAAPSLVELLKAYSNNQPTGYVRRYIIEALSPANVPHPAELFLSLVTDVDADVRTWVHSWYRQIETLELRDELIHLFDSSSPSVAADIAQALSLSALPDTGAALLERYDAGLEDSLACWTLRAAGRLAPHGAMTRAVRALREMPDTQRAEHALITLAEIGDEAAIDPLLEFAQRSISQRTESWFQGAFVSCASEEAFSRLEAIGRASHGELRDVIAETLASSGRYGHGFIIDYIRERGRQLMGVLAALGQVSSEPHGEAPFPPELVRLLYELVAARDELSPVALAILLNEAGDSVELAACLVDHLPYFPQPFETNIVLLNNSNNLVAIAPVARRFLRGEARRAATHETFARSFIELAAVLGDESTLDALRLYRPQFDALVGPRMIDLVEDVIARYGDEVRLGLPFA